MATKEKKAEDKSMEGISLTINFHGTAGAQRVTVSGKNVERLSGRQIKIALNQASKEIQKMKRQMRRHGTTAHESAVEAREAADREKKEAKEQKDKEILAALEAEKAKKTKEEKTPSDEGANMSDEELESIIEGDEDGS